MKKAQPFVLGMLALAFAAVCSFACAMCVYISTYTSSGGPPERFFTLHEALNFFSFIGRPWIFLLLPLLMAIGILNFLASKMVFCLSAKANTEATQYTDRKRFRCLMTFYIFVLLSLPLFISLYDVSEYFLDYWRHR